MNNACFKDQFDAGVPNLFPLSAARSMYEPFNKLKFYGAASYVDQVRAGINYFVKKKGKKAICAMYQDTDFGKEVLDGVQIQAEKMKHQDRGDGDAQADRPGLHRPDHQAEGGGLRPGRDGHHRARLDRALRHGAQDRLDRRRLPRLRRRLRSRRGAPPRAA